MPHCIPPCSLHRAWRRPAAVVLLTVAAMGAAGCDRRGSDPKLPTTGEAPATAPVPVLPEAGASAARR